MDEFVLTVARFGLLVLLWIFVFAVVRVVRRDMFATGRSRNVVAAPRTAQTAGPGGGSGQAVNSAVNSNAPAKVRKGRAAHQLVVTGGQLAGTKLTLGEAQITIGRAEDSTLVITDDYASARHARLVPRSGQWFIEDLGSTNGTYLDRSKISGPTPVPIGVPIRIGRTSIELRP